MPLSRHHTFARGTYRLPAAVNLSRHCPGNAQAIRKQFVGKSPRNAPVIHANTTPACPSQAASLNVRAFGNFRRSPDWSCKKLPCTLSKHHTPSPLLPFFSPWPPPSHTPHSSGKTLLTTLLQRPSSRPPRSISPAPRSGPSPLSSQRSATGSSRRPKPQIPPSSINPPPAPTHPASPSNPETT